MATHIVAVASGFGLCGKRECPAHPGNSVAANPASPNDGYAVADSAAIARMARV